MSDNLKAFLIHTAITAGTTFVLAIVTAINSLGRVEWNTTFWITVVVTAAISTAQEIGKSFTPQRLGGRRK